MLEGKTAVLYGVSESLRGAVARALAGAGARVFLTARRLENAAKIAPQARCHLLPAERGEWLRGAD
jgi:3-oxoacyl-[acyl-carrier protein] reductase